MPAAAVIPAPIAYIKVVAVKKLVVGLLAWATGRRPRGVCTVVGPGHPRADPVFHSFGGSGKRDVYCEKIRVFKAGLRCEYISME